MNVPSLTRVRCENIAKRIEDGFAKYGISPHPQSDVGKYLREMRWLPDCLMDPPVPGSPEHDRAVAAFLLVDQAANVATTFSMLAATLIPAEKIQILVKRLDRLNRVGDPEAREILFELEVAGRIARFPEIRVTFEEPDLQVQTPGSSVGIACKKVKSLSQLSGRISDAAGQGARSGIPFFVFVDVGDLVTPRGFLHATSEEELGQHVEQNICQIMPHYTSGVLRAFSKGTGGVVLCCRTVGIVEFENGLTEIRWFPTYHLIPNFGVDDAAGALAVVIDLMKVPGLPM